MTLSLPETPQLVIEPSRGWFNLKLKAVWRYRELLYFLIWRDIKVRYKQTVLGVAWVVIQPVVGTLVYSGLFGVLLQVPTGGVPYPLFVLTGLLPWQYFTSALTKSTNSVVDSASLVSKIYFPRFFFRRFFLFGHLELTGRVKREILVGLTTRWSRLGQPGC